MICIADTIADVGRYVVVSNMKKLFPAHQIVYLEEAELSSMAVPKEWLYLLAHGNTKEVAGHTPHQMAAKLLKKGLKTGTRIEVRACLSGVPSEPSKKTFVDELTRKINALSEGKVVVYAQGYTGVGVIQKDGSYLAYDDIKNNPEKQREYKDILLSSEAKEEIRLAEEFIEQALLKKMSIEDIADGVTQRTRKTFKLLYKYNLTVTKLPEPSMSSSSLREYIKALDLQWLSPSHHSWTLDILEGISWQAVHEWSRTVPPSSEVYRVLSGESQLH